MAQNVNQAPSQDWKNNTGEDFLHLRNSQGTLVGGIDNVGLGFGNLQGGFVPPPTKILYVDINRADSYTADGSILKPFKTIMAAVNQVITNGDNSTFNLLSVTQVQEPRLCNTIFTFGDKHDADSIR